MPISCHFRDCKALLVMSLTQLSGAKASFQTFTFTFTPQVWNWIDVIPYVEKISFLSILAWHSNNMQIPLSLINYPPLIRSWHLPLCNMCVRWLRRDALMSTLILWPWHFIFWPQTCSVSYSYKLTNYPPPLGRVLSADGYCQSLKMVWFTSGKDQNVAQ